MCLIIAAMNAQYHKNDSNMDENSAMARLSYIQVDRVCNQSCLFCSNPDTGEFMPLAKAKALVEMYKSNGDDGIIISGGEPTLYENLPELIAYCRVQKMPARIITNGQKTADLQYFRQLAEAGLQHMHVSVHSHRAAVQAELTHNRDSLANIVKTIYYAGKLGINIDINCCINSYNQDHLHEMVEWLCGKFPFLHHFSFNNLDPSMNRVDDNPHVIPKFAVLGPSLRKAFRYLEDSGRSFRVSKVPLCHIGEEFAYAVMETRKTILGESRTLYFLDDRKFVMQSDWQHGKTEICRSCPADTICAGVWGLGRAYDPAELHHIEINIEKVKQRVTGG